MHLKMKKRNILSFAARWPGQALLVVLLLLSHWGSSRASDPRSSDPAVKKDAAVKKDPAAKKDPGVKKDTETRKDPAARKSPSGPQKEEQKETQGNENEAQGNRPLPARRNLTESMELPPAEKKPPRRRKKGRRVKVSLITCFGGGLMLPLVYGELGVGLRFGRMELDIRAGGGYFAGEVAVSMGVYSLFRPRFRIRHGWLLRMPIPSSLWCPAIHANLADFWFRLSRRLWFVVSLLNPGYGTGFYNGALELRIEL